MITLQTVIENLKHVPSENLEKANEAVQALMAPKEANAELADWTMQFAGMLGHWTETEWADFQAELARTRAALFNRSVPEI